LKSCEVEVLPEWDLLNERIAKRRGTAAELIAAVRGRQADDLASVTLALAQTHLEGGSAARAADLLARVLELKPDREDVARRLVAALTAAGRLSEADVVRGEYLQ
jgi:predicted Zn-dependent protease